MYWLLDPLEVDGPEVRSIRLYQLVEAPGTLVLQDLVRLLLALHPPLASQVGAAGSLMLAGGFSNRVHFRRRFGLKPPDGPPSPF
jgi:hypothetical protein